ncbi:9695_t:CDS:2, partial [Racocetra fulgida]
IANFDVARKQNETTNEIPDLNKEPYHGIDTFEDIKKLVTNGYREKISFAPTQD